MVRIPINVEHRISIEIIMTGGHCMTKAEGYEKGRAPPKSVAATAKK